MRSTSVGVGVLFAIATVCVELAGCIAPELVACGDLACPAGSVCTQGGCATPEDAEACAHQVEGATCMTSSITAGTCAGGACHPAACGNGIIDLAHGESCDDGNQSPGDGCSADCRSLEMCGNAQVDVIRGEECDSGTPGLSGEGCTSACSFEIELWRDRTPAALGARTSAMVFDRARGVTVLFGGTFAGVVLGDTWEWDGTTWARRSPPTSPPARSTHAIAYDPVRRRVVVFGGRQGSQGSHLADTWEYDGVTWTEKTPAISPTPRSYATMAFDPVRGALVMFGGVSTGDLGDTWEWDGTTWTELPPTAGGPSPRQGAVLAFDDAAQRLVLFGGSSGQTLNNDTWALVGPAWSSVAISGSSPPGRNRAVLVADPANDRLLLFGGFASGTWLGDTWQLEAGAWSPIAVSPGASPPPRSEHGASFDSSRGVVVVFGGTSSAGPLADTWELVADLWTPRSSATMTGRIDHAIAYDPLRGRTVLFGGRTPQVDGQTWDFDGTSWRRRTPRDMPLARAGHAMAFDARRGRVVLFGGVSSSGLLFEDLWSWDGSNWELEIAGSVPVRRSFAALAYDSARDRLVLFGGRGELSSLDDTWEWDGTTWIDVTTATRPPAREGHALAFDAAREEIVLVGGRDASGSPIEGQWAWDGTSWTETTTATGPAARHGTQLAYDPLRRAITLFGGEDRFGALDDSWEWDGTAWSRRLPALAPSARSRHAMTYDAIHRRLFVASGITAAPADTWARGFESAAHPPERCADATEDSDGDGFAGCADPDCYGRCAPLCPPEAACDPAAPRCGDGACGEIEDYLICPSDCAPP